MRRALIGLVALVWPMAASAQSTLAPVPPLPPIGLPLPQITAPLTPIALTPADNRPQPNTRMQPRPRFDGRHRPPFQWPVIYFVDRYYVPMAVDASKREPMAREYLMAPTGQRTAETSAAAAAPAPQPEPAPEAIAPPTPEAPPPPSTFYYIPGCYMGNVPPSDVVLPAGCDRTRVIIRTPLRQ